LRTTGTFRRSFPQHRPYTGAPEAPPRRHVAPDKKLFAQLRRLDAHELRRVLIFVRGLLAALGDEAAAVHDPGTGVTYRLEPVRCGKAECKSCPHGPYWYAYFREGGRLRSRYIGRRLPEAGSVEENTGKSRY
jgi:hypothetical protein